MRYVNGWTKTATAAMAAGALLLATPAAGAERAGPPGHGNRAEIGLSADPQRVEVVPLPCLPEILDVGLENLSDEPVYADAYLTPEAPVEVDRPLISSYLPAGYRLEVPVKVTAPSGATPGEYDLAITAGRASLTVPVTVASPPPKGPGDDLALGEQAVASSTHGNFDVCGAVDGNRNSADWDTLTGWNDGTRAVFPDTYEVRLPASARIDRVDLYTLDSTRYPAARFGLKDWDVRARVGGEWTTVAQVRGNTAGMVRSTFAAVEADAIQIVALASNDGAYSRIVELEVYGGG